ncbi:hypothetical protein MACJ_003928 [Theileria orientalis]|uniref:Uncharacterized protein n=1 Tax=Theileria orientalis TaxID=68886 RepID=A0A976SL35_THEOR|nr:hypothetical protein MACJ_003928 [Theileria orientalis]
MVEWNTVRWNGETFKDGGKPTGDVPSDLKKLRELKHVDSYDASNPGNDDVVLYKSTWWRYVKGTGWVEQVFHQNTQRIMDKGLPEGGPNEGIIVKSFGEAQAVEKKRFEERGWLGDLYSWGYGYGPSDNQEGPYKIDSCAVVAYWDNRSNIWYNVKWDKNTQKFTKGDSVSPEGHATDKDKVRKWETSIKMSDVESGQEFYYDNKWWVKQGGQLVEQEWNPRNDQFRPKNGGLRGPSGKLVVGRFGKEMDIKELTGVNAYQDPKTGEVYMAVPDRAYVDAKTDVVYYYATNGVGHRYWWYARWDQGIGLFYATWKISYGPTSGKVRPWIPSTDGPFDLDAADDNVIVWHNNNFWKKIKGVWVQYRWDANNSKIKKEEKCGSPSGKGRPNEITECLIAPVGVNTTVKGFEDTVYSLNTLHGLGSAGKGAYKMENGTNIGNVHWWDGKNWYDANWDESRGEFSSGREKVGCYDTLLVRRWKYVTLSGVQNDQELWYRGTIWKKKGNELVQCTWNDSNQEFEEKSGGKRVPTGNNVEVERFVQEHDSGSVNEGKAYMDATTGRVYWGVA